MSRFAGGDHRVTRVRLAGLSAQELTAMARELGVGELSSRAVAQLIDHTGGNFLHCRALLEELGPGGLARAGDDLPAPRELAGVVLARLKALSGPARGWSRGVVLGRSFPLAAAAALARLDDPLAALDEAVGAGLLMEDRTGAGPQSRSPTRWSRRRSETIWVPPRAAPGCTGLRRRWSPAPPPSPTG